MKYSFLLLTCLAELDGYNFCVTLPLAMLPISTELGVGFS